MAIGLIPIDKKRHPTVAMMQYTPLMSLVRLSNCLKAFIYIFVTSYELILECWNFKADLRPSFHTINEKLSQILAKYEEKKLVELQSILDIKQQPFHDNLSLNFTKSTSLSQTPKRLLQMGTPERKSSLSKVWKKQVLNLPCLIIDFDVKTQSVTVTTICLYLSKSQNLKLSKMI